MATPAWELIDSNTLSASASSVTFSVIPQGYRDLVLVIDFVAASGFVAPNIQLNSDTGTNYSYVLADGRGTSAISGAGSGQTQLYGTNSVSSGDSGMAVVQFMDYSATDKHKTILTRANNTQTNSTVRMSAQRWANTSAITQIFVFDSSDNFAAGSTFYLWGLNRL